MVLFGVFNIGLVWDFFKRLLNINMNGVRIYDYYCVFFIMNVVLVILNWNLYESVLLVIDWDIWVWV